MNAASPEEATILLGYAVLLAVVTVFAVALDR